MPIAIKDEISSKLSGFNFNSADAFSRSIFSGLVENIGTKLNCINILPLGAYPRYNKIKYFKGDQSYEYGIRIKSIPYSTLIGYMYYSIFHNLYKELKTNIDKEKDNVFIIYSINIPVLKAVIRYKERISPKTKIILIVPDLLEYSMEDTIASKIKMKIFGDVNDYYGKIDGFVLLTKAMRDKIGPDKPSCIIEGIYNNTEKRTAQNEKSEVKTIFYSGMLYAKFGVKNLIDAFSATHNSSYRLQLCGCGDLEDYIKQQAAIDSRINYLGLIPREKVLELQSKADLLINPRQPIEEFTKYSFPSKNIEYLVSGTPVLIYELDGIPEEYYKFCFHIDKKNLNIEYLTGEIERILSLSKDELRKYGENARNFVIKEKNSKKQVQKIIQLINEI